MGRPPDTTEAYQVASDVDPDGARRAGLKPVLAGFNNKIYKSPIRCFLVVEVVDRGIIMDSFIQGAIMNKQREDREQSADSTGPSEAPTSFSTPSDSTPIQNAPKKEEPTPSHDSNKPDNLVDEELEELLSHQKAKIKVIGIGGGGGNTINRMAEVGIIGAETIALNTDAQDLLYTSADTKILLGKDLAKGLGAGGTPKVGEEAARESETQVRNSLNGADMVFITCGLGGGTGTGAAPVVADISKRTGALTIAVVTIPFDMEGARRKENAFLGLEMLEKNVDTLIVIPNDKLLDIASDLPLHTAFKVADEILTNSVKGMAELVTKAGLVNLDFADIRSVMGDGGIALIGVGESDSDNRAIEAVEKAINNPLLDVDITGATGALLNVIGGSDMRLDEAKTVMKCISDKLDSEATMIWGAQIAEDLEGTLRVMLIVTGVHSQQITGRKSAKFEGKKEIESDLGIEFLD